MPTTMGRYIAGLTAGTEVSSTYEGRHVTVLETELIHPNHSDDLVNKGDPVIIVLAAATPHTVRAQAVGVALSSATAETDYIAIDTEGIFNLNVNADDDAGNEDVNPGDALFISDDSAASDDSSHDGVGDAVLSKIRNNALQVPFGYALGYIAGGAYGEIAVKVHWDPLSHWLLDTEKLYFGDAPDVSIEWNETFLAMAITAVSKAWGIDVAISAAALADGYGFIETNANVEGAATGATVARSDWLNLGDTFVAEAGGSVISPHTDGIYMTTSAVITGAWVALCGKFTDQMDESNFALYNLWNLNLTQTLDALIEVNDPALLGYIASAATGAIGSIPFFTTGGTGTKYIMIYSNPA